MASDSGIPEQVRALLHGSLPSMVHVETLLLLGRTTPKGWDRHQIATEIKSSPALVAAALADLETAKLVRSTPGTEPPEFRLDTSDAVLPGVVAQLQEEYDRRPVTLIRVMYERPAQSPIQAFADAFRVRRSGDT